MSGETDLRTLLHSMTPVLDQQEYVFATVRDEDTASLLKPIGIFHEAEGISIICTQAATDLHGIARSSTVFRKITLTIHSSLDAVGLTAAVAGALARHDIPCNVVAGFYHDHLFVPKERAAEALAVLARLSDPGVGPGSPLR